MYFKQGDIFWGMKKEFVGEIMKIAVTESYDKSNPPCLKAAGTG
jgi:hypothetical protein